jgi:cobalt-zinc-cadmium efflux system outer membrane protein
MRKIFFMLVFIFSLLSVASADNRQELPEIQNLSSLVQEALDNNPGLEAAVQRALSAERVIPQAGSLPDPKITLGLMNLPVNSFAFNQEPMTGKQISIMQMFPFPGKLSLSTEMAEYEAAAVKYQQREMRNQIVLMVKRTYYDLYAVDRALETVQKNKDIMGQLVRVAEIKYATGSGLQQDVLRAQVELSKLEDDLIMWQQKRLAVVAKLNAILNRPSGTPIGVTLPNLELPESEDLTFSQQDIEHMRPLILAWKEKLDKSDTAVKFARKDMWPNIAVGMGYSQRDDLKSGAKMHDFFSASVTLDIPLFYKRKQSQKIAEKRLDFEAARADFRNVLNGILAESESQKAELGRNRKRVELYKGGILIQAEQSLESAQAGYQVGKVDFLNVVDNWMRLLNFELQYHFAMSEYHKALASYDFAVGKGSDAAKSLPD